jgi:hypothetical protein
MLTFMPKSLVFIKLMFAPSMVQFANKVFFRAHRETDVGKKIAATSKY